MKLWQLLAVVLVALAFLSVGSFDYQDELDELEYYCSMVREGAWPDYKEIFEKECKTEELVVDSETPSN